MSVSAYVPYPFAAIVGQDEAKLAILLAAINPRVGGVLLSGPKGVGKTTIVRAVDALLPTLLRADCAYGCDPAGSARCAQCADAARAGVKTKSRRARAEIAELPANAQIDDVVGTIDVRAALERGAFAFRPGLLARANRTLLYVDEINLLSDAVVDVLLDAAAQGVVRVKRGQHAVDYPARFTLIGSMNPEEGELRPQITDRIGLRVFAAAAADPAERVEIYRRNASFARDPHAFVAAYAPQTRSLRARLARAVRLLPSVRATHDAEFAAVDGVVRLGIDSHRAEFVALEAACALAALEGRTEASAEDVRRVFPLAARLRRSRLRVQALSEHLAEDAAIASALDAQRADAAPPPAAPETEAQPPRLVVSPAFTERAPVRARAQVEREGQSVDARPLGTGRLDVVGTVVDRAVAARAGRVPEPKESVDAAAPLRLTVFVVDASQSTAASAEAVQAAGRDVLRPIYAERERAALISCWGAAAEVAVDENVGRNVELVAERLAELAPGEEHALTPLPDAIDRARRIAERFRRAHPSAQAEIVVFSDGRANVPLGADADLRRALASDGDVRALAETAREQCRALAARLPGRAGTTFVNLDRLETSPLMRELASIAQGRYFAIDEIVAAVSGEEEPRVMTVTVAPPVPA